MNPTVHIVFIVVSFRIALAHSLKEKRRVISSLKDRLRQQFNISIAEIDTQDQWQLGTFGITMLSNDRAHVERTIEAMRLKFIERHEIEVVEFEQQWL